MAISMGATRTAIQKKGFIIIRRRPIPAASATGMSMMMTRISTTVLLGLI